MADYEQLQKADIGIAGGNRNFSRKAERGSVSAPDSNGTHTQSGGAVRSVIRRRGANTIERIQF